MRQYPEKTPLTDTSEPTQHRHPLTSLAGIGGWVSSIVLFSLMAMTCIDVVGRYFFNSPLDGATELTQLMLGIIVFAVLPSVCRTEEHVSVDLLDIWFPDRWINVRQIILNLAMAIIMTVVTWRVWIRATRMAEYGDTTEFLAIPYAPITFFISIMSGIAAISFAVNILHYAKNQGPMSPNTVETTN